MEQMSSLLIEELRRPPLQPAAPAQWIVEQARPLARSVVVRRWILLASSQQDAIHDVMVTLDRHTSSGSWEAYPAPAGPVELATHQRW